MIVDGHEELLWAALADVRDHCAPSSGEDPVRDTTLHDHGLRGSIDVAPLERDPLSIDWC